MPWTTITTIMDKIKDEQERLWYAEKFKNYKSAENFKLYKKVIRRKQNG